MPRKPKIWSLPRLGGVGAIGFAAVIFLTNVAIMVPAGLPTTGASENEVVAFFSTSGGAVAWGTVFIPMAWVLATLFGAGAVSAVWRSELPRGEAWSLVGFAGLLAQNVTFAGVIGLRLALAGTATLVTTLGLWRLHEALFTLNGTFLALALAGLSISGLRAGLIRPWLATVGFLSAALNFASASLTPMVMEHGGAFGYVGLAGWLLWVFWLVAYGVRLLRWTPRANTAQAPASSGEAHASDA